MKALTCDEDFSEMSSDLLRNVVLRACVRWMEVNVRMYEVSSQAGLKLEGALMGLSKQRADPDAVHECCTKCAEEAQHAGRINALNCSADIS